MGVVRFYDFMILKLFILLDETLTILSTVIRAFKPNGLTAQILILNMVRLENPSTILACKERLSKTQRKTAKVMEVGMTYKWV